MRKTLLLLLLLACQCRAQIIGTDPVPNEPGKVSLSYTYIGSDGSVRFDRSGNPSIKLAQSGDINSLRIIIGVAQDLDFTITTGEGLISRENGSRFTSPTFGHGSDDTQLRVRWRFLHEDDLQIAALFTTTVPTGSVGSEDRLGIGQGFVSQTFALTARQDFDRFQLWTEGFYAFPLQNLPGRETNRVWGANLALGYMIGDSVQPTIELNYVNSTPDIQALSYTGGLTWIATENFIVMGGVQQVFYGVNSDKVTRPIIRLIYNF